MQPSRIAGARTHAKANVTCVYLSQLTLFTAKVGVSVGEACQPVNHEAATISTCAVSFDEGVVVSRAWKLIPEARAPESKKSGSEKKESILPRRR